MVINLLSAITILFLLLRRYLVTTVPLIGCLLARAHDYSESDRPPRTPLRQQFSENSIKQSSFSRCTSETHSQRTCTSVSALNIVPLVALRYDTIRYDTMTLTCARKRTSLLASLVQAYHTTL